jgi:hypothetical protein
MSDPDERARPESPPRHVGRRRFLKAAVALAAFGAGTAAYASCIEPTWVEVTEGDLPVPGLPPAWEGARLAHVTDLHLGPLVPAEYLARCLHRTADLGPDLVVVTGDFVTVGRENYGPRAARLMEGLAPPLGVFACLGNHDYGLTRRVRRPVKPSSVVDDLREVGVRVLSNESVRLSREGGDLWIAGVEDSWSGRCDPARAMTDVPPGAPAVTLCHNPDEAESLAAAGCRAILSGHTHGGQIDLPLIGPPILPVQHRDRYRGVHRVDGAWLYVNRGLGWLWQVRFRCRPEIALFTLRVAPADQSLPIDAKASVTA